MHEILRRLRALWHPDEPVNQGHRYGIVIGDSCYMADAYRISKYDGNPEWYYSGVDGNIHCRKMDGWALKDFQPETSLEEFEE